jgi:hypothetical protein
VAVVCLKENLVFMVVVCLGVNFVFVAVVCLGLFVAVVFASEKTKLSWLLSASEKT